MYSALKWRVESPGHNELRYVLVLMVDHRCSACDQTIPYAMESLQVELVVGLDRNKAHVLPIDSLGNRFRIVFREISAEGASG
jgi:hypothetical protein